MNNRNTVGWPSAELPGNKEKRTPTHSRIFFRTMRTSTAQESEIEHPSRKNPGVLDLIAKC